MTKHSDDGNQIQLSYQPSRHPFSDLVPSWPLGALLSVQCPHGCLLSWQLDAFCGCLRSSWLPDTILPHWTSSLSHGFLLGSCSSMHFWPPAAICGYLVLLLIGALLAIWHLFKYLVLQFSCPPSTRYSPGCSASSWPLATFFGYSPSPR